MIQNEKSVGKEKGRTADDYKHLKKLYAEFKDRCRKYKDAKNELRKIERRLNAIDEKLQAEKAKKEGMDKELLNLKKTANEKDELLKESQSIERKEYLKAEIYELKSKIELKEMNQNKVRDLIINLEKERAEIKTSYDRKKSFRNDKKKSMKDKREEYLSKSGGFNEEQKKSLFGIILNYPKRAGSIAYFIMTTMGAFSSAAYYKTFGINIIQYSNWQDFFLALFYAPESIIVVPVVLALYYFIVWLSRRKTPFFVSYSSPFFYRRWMLVALPVGLVLLIVTYSDYVRADKILRGKTNETSLLTRYKMEETERKLYFIGSVNQFAFLAPGGDDDSKGFSYREVIHVPVGNIVCMNVKKDHSSHYLWNFLEKIYAFVYSLFPRKTDPDKPGRNNTFKFPCKPESPEDPGDRKIEKVIEKGFYDLTEAIGSVDRPRYVDCAAVKKCPMQLRRFCQKKLDGPIIEISPPICFGRDKRTIESGMAGPDGISKMIEKYKRDDVGLAIFGFASPDGGFGHNQRLSRDRAKETKKWLNTNLAIDQNIETYGMGEQHCIDGIAASRCARLVVYLKKTVNSE